MRTKIQKILLFILVHQILKNPVVLSGGKGPRASLANKQHQNTRRRILQEWKTVKESGLALELKRAALSSLRAHENSTASSGEVKRADPIRLAPLPHNMFHWHFSFGGVPGSPYEGGVYHGQIILPLNYPNSPPRVQMLTPNGRFQVKTDICLSASAYHPETWAPSWTVTTIVMALRTHMLTDAHEIGGVNATPETRRKLARASHDFSCRACGTHHAHFCKKSLEYQLDQIQSTKETGSTETESEVCVLSRNCEVGSTSPSCEGSSLQHLQEELLAYSASKELSILKKAKLFVNSTIMNKSFWFIFALGFAISICMNTGKCVI